MVAVMKCGHIVALFRRALERGQKRADPRCAISLVSSSSLSSSLAPISSASSCHHALTLTIAFLSHRAATSPPPRLHRASASHLLHPSFVFASIFPAVSLHAPAQDIRCQIMPAARAFPLQKLMASLQEYQRNSQQKILIEYIILDGVNDEEQHAHQSENR
ncbi:putative dual-specificity RNA methyltransferase RlmN [Arachis hypogaea]|nr:putative dual-specificity RNA methyltransferase RlmN [Arachis hypogaea]